MIFISRSINYLDEGSNIVNTPFPLTGFEGQDLRSFVDERSKVWGNKPFLIWAPFDGPEQSWTYAGFAAAVRRFAAGLAARGLQPGDRLLVHLENCPESIICWLGAAYAGVVAVTTNSTSTRDELAYYATHSKARGAVTQPRFARLVADAAPALEWLVITGSDGDTPRGDFFNPRAEAFAAIDGDPASLPARPHDPMAHFAIQYTSGTTARPKAVLWTHANGLWGAKVSAMHEELSSQDVHLLTLPLFHTNAQVYSVLASLEVGATVVLQPRFSASRFWPVSLKYGCTWASMVPFCVRALGQLPVPANHRYRVWANAACDPPTDEVFDVKTIGWWSMTETISHGIVGSTHRTNAPMSIGRPSPAYLIHVLDEHGHPVRPGETGDLFVEGRRGVSLFLEYADDPEATAAAFRPDGLLITGDRVRLGQEGCLYFADRAKDMLKVGGENVSASEIEQAILTTPGVVEAAVVGMPDAMLDEVPVAFVIPQNQSDETLVARVAATCSDRLAPFKLPKNVILVSELPRSTLNKVAKAELRRMVCETR